MHSEHRLTRDNNIYMSMYCLLKHHSLSPTLTQRLMFMDGATAARVPMSISRIVGTEENIWSTRLGLKGIYCIHVIAIYLSFRSLYWFTVCQSIGFLYLSIYLSSVCVICTHICNSAVVFVSIF